VNFIQWQAVSNQMLVLLRARLLPSRGSQLSRGQSIVKKFIVMPGWKEALFPLVGLITVVIVCIFVCYFYWRRRRRSRKPSRRAILSNLPIVTVTANNILLDSLFQMDRITRLSLEILVKRACVFLMIAVKDESELDAIRGPVISQFRGLIPPSQILFSQISLGRVLLARQLEAVAHIDFDPDVVHEASLFLKTALIAPPEVASARATWSSPSFTTFVTNESTDFFNLLNH
jgi:hypothetical protein